MSSTIRVRYAKALFLAAKEKGRLEESKTDIEKIFDVCNHSVEFILLLNSPVVKTSQKVSLIQQIFKNEIDTLSLNFLTLVTNNKRENEIPGICRDFLGMVRKEKNIKTASLITAQPIGNKTAEKIKTLVEKELNATVELSSSVNPEIIGGMILRIDDKQYDSSVATQLKKIRQKLLESEIKS
jgi:F-type H+-transporting ATPase subunit delta